MSEYPDLEVGGYSDFDDFTDEDPTYEENLFDVVESSDEEGEERVTETYRRVTEAEQRETWDAEHYIRGDDDLEYEDGFLQRDGGRGVERGRDSERVSEDAQEDDP